MGRWQGFNQLKLAEATHSDVALFGGRCASMLRKNLNLSSEAYKCCFPMGLFCPFLLHLAPFA